MDRIIFERNFDNQEGIVNQVNPGECKRIIFEIQPEMDVFEFQQICKRLGSAIGFHSSNLDQAFGEDS